MTREIRKYLNKMKTEPIRIDGIQVKQRFKENAVTREGPKHNDLFPK